MWRKLQNYNLPEANWILMGEFNMIESLDDKQGGSKTTRRG